MNNPKKIIYKYKNINKRIQYQLFIFIGSNVPNNIKKNLNKIKNLDFYNSLISLSLNEFKELSKYYDAKWYKYFFPYQNIKLNINLILKNINKKNNLIKKYGKEWFNLNISKKQIIKMYSYNFLFKKEKEIKERNNKKITEDIENNYAIDRSTSISGSENVENVENVEIEEEEFDLEEIENMQKSIDNIDNKLNETTKLINKIYNDNKKKIVKNIDINKFPQDKDDTMYDDLIKNLFQKIYIENYFLYDDDSIIKIKEKICNSIKLNNLFISSGKTKHDAYILPSRIYLWCNYEFIDQSDNLLKNNKIMLGTKWIKKNELLNIDIEPKDNIFFYENLKGGISDLREDMRKYGSKIKKEDDNNNLLQDYSDYIKDNEIFIIDIYNYCGLNYNPSSDKLRNMYDIFIKIYFPKINMENFKNIINYLNILKNEEKRLPEIKYMENVIKTLDNDLLLEKNIMNSIINIDLKSNKLVKFSNNYITHTVIHTVLTYANKYGKPVIELFRIFDNFKLSKKYPFIQYQLANGKMIYKFFNKEIEDDKDAILSKWFENSPYGISFKIKVSLKGNSLNKYIALSLNEIGRLQYKIQWKEDDKATITDIYTSYNYIQELIDKINNENNKIEINIPQNDDFKFAFINSIQKFELSEKHNINHNDLSNFARYFYPYVALITEPRKRMSKYRKTESSKYGTYLRYKRVTKYENKAKIENRIIYFMRNYDYTDKQLIKEISKQFNINESRSIEEIQSVKKKYPVIKKSKKNLKNITIATKYKPPGIGVDIVGKSRINYKIRISGARSKNQLFKIIEFLNILIFLYIEIYILKNKKYLYIKDKLKTLTNIAKRTNKVNDIIDTQDIIVKDVKKKTKTDKNRLGFKPSEGFSHWTRLCQNSGTDNKRQPTQYTSKDLEDLYKKGYKYNKKTGYYERIVDHNGEKIILRAIELTDFNDPSKKIYYSCDPEHNKKNTYIDFLSKSKMSDNICRPCCYKKDPLKSKNKNRYNYFMQCTGKLDKKEIKKNDKKKLDKLYVLQHTNKIQQGKFCKLPKILDHFLNKLNNFNIVIKNHYLDKTSPIYLLKYGVTLTKNSFLDCICLYYDLTFEEIKKLLINKLNNDKNDQLFTSLDSGNIKTQFKTKQKFIDFIKINDILDYNLFRDFISKKNVISENGINLYIFEKKSKILQKELEKKQILDDYILKCNSLENDIFLKDKTRDNLIILLDNNIYYPIYQIQKIKINSEIKIQKIFKYNEFIKKCEIFYNISCNKNVIKKFRKKILYNVKFINFYLKNTKIKIVNQLIDSRNKCRYLILNNDSIIPVYPSGILHNIKFSKFNNKYLKSVNKSFNNLLFIDNLIKELDYKPTGFLYNNNKKNKYNFIGFIIREGIHLNTKNEIIHENDIKTYAKKSNKREFLKLNASNEELIDFAIENKTNIIIDERILDISRKKFKKENYQLFKLEFSNYLNIVIKIKNKLIEIINNKHLLNSNKKKLLKNILIEELYNKKASFIKIQDIKKNTLNYEINNIRDICNVNNKNQCKTNLNCHWDGKKCKFDITEKNLIYYINLISEELINNEMKSKEILSLDNYYVSDIVDYNTFQINPNQKIIKSDVQNIKYILSNIFGKNNIPNIGRRKNINYGRSIFQENLDNPPIKLGNIITQNIIYNNNTFIRTYTNLFYWKNNNLLDNDNRNLGYFSQLQTDISNYLRGQIIYFLTNDNNNLFIKTNYQKYMNKSINNYIFDNINNDIISNNGVVELAILSKLFNNQIIIFNNFNKIIYYIDNGIISIDSKQNNKIVKYKHMMNIMYDYSDNSYPSIIKCLYYF